MEDPPAEAAPAALLAAQLRSNGTAPIELRFDATGGWFEESWTAAERTDVLIAAWENRSVRSVEVNVSGMSQDAAEGIACVISRLVLVDAIGILGSPGDCFVASRAVDALLRGVTATRESAAAPITTLRMDARSSPQALLDFADRFPSISFLVVAGHCACNKHCPAYGCFATSVAMAISQLPCLWGVRLHSNGTTGYLSTLLQPLNASKSVRSLDLILSCADVETWHEISLFCAFTTSVEKVTVIGATNAVSGLIDMTYFLDVGLRLPFSPHLKQLRFFKCRLEDSNEAFHKAVMALNNLEVLSFGRCRIPSAFVLLRKLPNLKKFSSNSRSVYVRRDDTLEEEFDQKRYMLGTNADLEELIEALDKLKALEEVEVDLVGQEESLSTTRVDRSFPAISPLLLGSQGALLLNLGKFPWLTCEHIAWGMKGLSTSLTELRIRCFRCDFTDANYAAILRPLESNATLTTFELGFDPEAELGTPTASITAIRNIVGDNRALQTMSLRGLNSDAAFSLLEQISPALAFTNRSLQVLDLRNVDLTEHWPTLRLSLLILLQENGVFSSLGTCRIPEDDPDAIKFRFLLKQNQYGRRLLLRPSHLKTARAIWATVLERVAADKEHRVMYAFLRGSSDILVPAATAAPAPPLQG